MGRCRSGRGVKPWGQRQHLGIPDCLAATPAAAAKIEQQLSCTSGPADLSELGRSSRWTRIHHG